MNNIKIIKKKKEKYVYTKLLATQSLNQREIEMLGSSQMVQLITPQVKMSKKPEILYNVNSYLSLREYLHQVTTKGNFLRIVLSILDMMKEAQQKLLYVANFVLDMDYIFVDPTTKELRYIYLPICNYEQEFYIKGLLMTLAYDTVFNHLEDCSYVTEYISYFNTHPNFSVYDFEMFLREMNGEEVIASDKNVNIAHPSKLLNKDAKICLKCDITYLSRNNFCEKCGGRLTFVTPSKQLGQSAQLQQAQPSVMQPQLQQQAQPQVIQSQVVQAQPAPQPMGTTVLGVVESGTTVLSPQELGVVVYPYIVRKSNGEKITVNTSDFSVGQGATSNYVVTGNTAVSRNHARIVTRNGQYYIIDNQSTNGTYIDDVKLVPNMETEIVSGQKLRFANEEYEFLV